MHELSIAMSIIELVPEEPVVAAGARVEAVHLKVGQLSGVATDALIFSYEVACRDTRLLGSRLVVAEVPILVLCTRCGETKPVESLQSFRCQDCGTPSNQILQGRELVVTALEILS